MNTERLEMIVEPRGGESLIEGEGDEAGGQERQKAFFCTMNEYTGLSNSIRFPGSIDNQRLSFVSEVAEHCSPPFLRPKRQCAAEGGGGGGGEGTSPAEGPGYSGGGDQTSAAAGSIFDKACVCEPVRREHGSHAISARLYL